MFCLLVEQKFKSHGSVLSSVEILHITLKQGCKDIIIKHCKKIVDCTFLMLENYDERFKQCSKASEMTWLKQD
ncbi:hypothetical protein RIF29_00700 [Crotalaria pallida]|uniref:Uncharacterized protein n=1 Tax=Crotalaria pallida TaxID=3830 RepID=A0AAN9IXT3_CROPI